jgi:hypothetical protein
MKKLMKPLNYKSKLTAVIALLVIATAGASIRTKAQDQLPPPVNDRHALFGLLSITRGQTARLSVADLTPPPVGELPPGPIRVEMSFVDADGHFLLNPDGQPIRRVVMLEPRRSTFLQINANNLLARDENRLNFRPVVKVLPPPIPDSPTQPPPIGERVVPTVEIIENATAKTVLLYPGVIRGFNPQPDPPRE